MIIEKSKAKQILLSGGNLIIPTETVYGLAASIYFPEAIERIYQLKNRPRENPLIVHCANVKQVLEFVQNVPKNFLKLAENFWPGPLTIILEARDDLNPQITAGLKTVAVRVPNHKETKALLEETGPLVAPSANLSGKPSSTKVAHIENDFGKEFPILEGEEPTCGVESTIIGWIDQKWVLLRYGFIPKEAIELVLGKPIDHSNLQICPGTRFRHYSPDAKIFTQKEMKYEGDAIIGYENRAYGNLQKFYSLGRDDNPEEIAHNLFAIFRKIDEDGLKKVWIDTELPMEGLYLTIKERISKAAS